MRRSLVFDLITGKREIEGADLFKEFVGERFLRDINICTIVIDTKDGAFEVGFHCDAASLVHGGYFTEKREQLRKCTTVYNTR